ncbi:hypothetical protein, partial [Streptomyces sp. MAI_2237]
MCGMGLVGFLDDYIKIVKRRFAGPAGQGEDGRPAHRRHQLRGARAAVLRRPRQHPGVHQAVVHHGLRLDHRPVLFVVWALFMILAMSNGVNLTDGLDGLATGASVLVFGAYTFIGVWQFQESCANAQTLTNPGACYEVRDPLDLAVIASALMGALSRLPVVEHLAGQDLHRRTGSHRPRRLVLTGPGHLIPHGAAGCIQWAVCSSSSHESVVIQSAPSASPQARHSGWRPCRTTSKLKGWSRSLVVVRFWIIQGNCVIVRTGPLLAGNGQAKVTPRWPEGSSEFQGKHVTRRRARRLRHTRRPRCCTRAARSCTVVNRRRTTHALR